MNKIFKRNLKFMNKKYAIIDLDVFVSKINTILTIKYTLERNKSY